MNTSKIWNAAHAGNLLRLKYFLTDGLHEIVSSDLLQNPNTPKVLVKMPRRCDGSTPLFAAAAGGHGTCLEYLISVGADINAPRHDGATPFYIACLMGHLPLVQLIYKIRGSDAFNDSTLDDWTPLLAAVQRGHQDIAVFLLDAHRKCHTLKEHRRYIEKRTVRGHAAIQLAKKRGQTSIAAYIEWSIGKPGTADHSRAPDAQGKGFMKHRIPRKADSEAACGLQAYVENKGRWGYEADEDRVDPVPIRDYGFDTTTPKFNLCAKGDMWHGFGPQPAPRAAGGCATSLNVYECLGQTFRDSSVEIVEKPLIGKFAKAKAKLSEAQNTLEHGDYDAASKLFTSAAVLFSLPINGNLFFQDRVTSGNLGTMDMGSRQPHHLKSPYEKSLLVAKTNQNNKEDKQYADANQRVCQKMAEHCKRAHVLESK